MASFCEHYPEDDVKFLLDDENSSIKCSECNGKFQENQANFTTSTLNQTYVTASSNLNGTAVSNCEMDDHVDTLEDSPLLINDCFHPGEDYHCHSLLIETEDKRAWRKLLTASILCFLFMITELIGGLLAGSLAIMTDAAHLFSDFIGFLISLLSIWIARKPPSKTMTFGYHRAEVLGAFLSVLSIWLLAAIFAVLAINRIVKQEYDIDANTMMLVATLGLIVNIVMGAVLYGIGHNHSHGLNSQDHSVSNINVRAAIAHVLGDILQSTGVLIAAVIIKVFPNAQLADPICTLLFSFIVICTTAKVAKDSIWLLVEGSPINSGELAFELQSLPSVRHIHNLHIFTLSPGKNSVSVHLCVDTFCDRDFILKKATFLIQKKLNVISCTIQVEKYNSELINSCKYCQTQSC